MSEEEKDKIKECKRKRYQYKKEALQNKLVLFLLSIKISEKTLKFDNIRINKKEFHKSKQSNVDQIVVSDKFKFSDDGFKYFIGYNEGEIVKLLFIILRQMIEYSSVKWSDLGRF